MSFILLGILNAQAAGAGGEAYDYLETINLTASASSITFTGLDAYSSYKHLQIREIAKTDRNNEDVTRVRFNGVTSGSYAWHYLTGDFNSATSGNASSQTSILGPVVAGSGDDDPEAFGANIYDILDFSNTSKNTTLRAFGGHSPWQARMISGLFNNTSAITSINIYPNGGTVFTAGSRWNLYGIRG